MEYTRLEDINQYKGEGINPLKTPDKIFELYSVPEFDSGRPEVIKGRDIGSSKATVKKNDILLCKINPRINRVWVVGDYTEYQSIASSEWIVVRNNEYNPEYLAWYFRTPRFKKLMTSQVTGIGGSLTRAQPKQVKKYPVPVLNRNEQDEVVNVLNKADEIIAVKKKELEQLDILIKARFVEMFGEPSTPGQKYKVVKLGEVADVKSSHRVFTTEFVDKGVPFYRGTEIGELAAGKAPENPFYISQEHYDIIASDDSKPNVGDLLMPSICNKGQIWMVDTEEPFYYKDGRVLCISPNKSIFNSKYLQWYMKMRTEAEYPKLGSGSTFAEFKIFQLKGMEVDLPPMPIQNQFADFVHQVDKSKSVVQKSLDETQVLFDSLMQKYFG